MMLLRHLLSIAILPFTVTVLVPRWLLPEPIVTSYSDTLGSTWDFLAGIIGMLVILIGLALFAWSLSRFAKDGKGTLAPWDPPRQFVVTGPYRYVRNPMISGVIIILLGEALFFRSMPILWWAVIFFAGNAIQIPLMEEPILRAKFGPPYEEYCRHVGRLVPRLTPWTPAGR